MNPLVFNELLTKNVKTFFQKLLKNQTSLAATVTRSIQENLEGLVYTSSMELR